MRTWSWKNGLLYRYDFADLDYGFAAVVFALVGNEVGCGGGDGGVEVEHGFEIEMADGVVVRWRAGRKGADAAIDLDAHETARPEELAGEHKVRTEIVVPVEGGFGDGGIHHAKTDHGLGIQG